MATVEAAAGTIFSVSRSAGNSSWRPIAILTNWSPHFGLEPAPPVGAVIDQNECHGNVHLTVFIWRWYLNGGSSTVQILA